MKTECHVSGFCKVTAIIYYIYVAICTILFGVLTFGWILAGMAAFVTKIVGVLEYSLLLIVYLVVVFGIISVQTHSAILLWAPRRKDCLIYYVYQIIEINAAIISMCIGIFLIRIKIVPIAVVVLFFSIICAVPILGSIAFALKRREELEKKLVIEPTVTKKSETHASGIRMIKGQYAGAFFPLNKNEELIIGTNSKFCHILFDNQKISRKHCAIGYSDLQNRYYVIDYSKNGTYTIDGTKLPTNKMFSCPSGTILAIAHYGEIFELV